MPSFIKRRKRANGSFSYCVSFPAVDQDGNPTSINKTYDKLKDAKEFLRKLQEEQQTDEVVKPSDQTVGAYLDEWLECLDVRGNTHESYAALLEKHVRKAIGGTRLRDLTKLKIQNKVYGPMRKAGLSPRTVRLVHSVLHHALDDAVKDRKLRKNPAAGAKLPKKVKTEFRALEVAEARAFFEAVGGDPLEALFHVLLTTGIRPSEAFALKWEDLDLEGGSLAVRRSLTRTKGGHWKLNQPKTASSRRTIPLPDPTVEALKRHKARQGEIKMKLGAWPEYNFVFTNGIGEPLERHNVVRRHFKPALVRLADSIYKTDKTKRETLQHTRLYDLRHTCATLALTQGVNVKVVSERLGHKSVVITLDTYVHALENMQQGATDALSKVLYG